MCCESPSAQQDVPGLEQSEKLKIKCLLSVRQCSCASPFPQIRTMTFQLPVSSSMKKQMSPLKRGSTFLIFILTGATLCSTPLQVHFQHVYAAEQLRDISKGLQVWLRLRWHFLYSFPVKEKALLIWELPATQDQLTVPYIQIARFLGGTGSEASWPNP